MPLTAERKPSDVDRKLQRLTHEIERLKQRILKMDNPLNIQGHRELHDLHDRLDHLMSEHYKLQLERRKGEGQK